MPRHPQTGADPVLRGDRLASRWSEVGGLRLHHRESVGTVPERAPTVVLVHGAAVSSRTMVPVGEALAPRCRVYSPDLPGHGRSDDAPRVLDSAGMADALRSWMDVVGLDSPALLGNSFGCQIIAAFARRHPGRLSKAVLQGPTTDRHTRGPARQLGRWLVNSVREGATQPGVTFRDWGDAGLRVFSGTLYHMLTDRIEDDLPHVHVPTLVVRGGRDPIVPQPWAEEVTRLLPDGRLRVVPGETHTLVFAAGEKLAATVMPFLAEDGG